ncbi:hypothetical protein H6G96_32605 [Nostoc sp. FACHB-892]|uniref:hypothetical protein n=1 Tax=Nostoc sp. FACHB-892 TaxID=2692843 RepID=UPI0016879AF2|nr:hypothetical protein [Nostoc sp. FACHB-892]MBD2730934.1 hypothetical protein [Nostoc sp. FACHB-892]
MSKFHKNEIRIGGYADALRMMEEKGGMVFPPRADAKNVQHTTLQIGNRSITFWPEGSESRLEELRQLGEVLGLEEHDPLSYTPGRLARRFLEEVIRANDFSVDPHPRKYARYWGDKYLKMAQDGSHWHYIYYQPISEPVYAIELDLKSAYFTSLLSFDSLFYHQDKGFRPDGGALERFRQLAPILSQYKDFRLQLLGILAQYEKRFEKFDENLQLVRKTQPDIAWGSAFNATHKAIKNVFDSMQHCHQMLGKYLLRSHTDCLLIRADTPEEVENRVVSYLNRKSFTLACKKQKGKHKFGLSKFWDINTGIIGRHPVGGKITVEEFLERDGISVELFRQPVPEEIVKRWSKWLDNSSD